MRKFELATLCACLAVLPCGVGAASRLASDSEIDPAQPAGSPARLSGHIQWGDGLHAYVDVDVCPDELMGSVSAPASSNCGYTSDCREFDDLKCGAWAYYCWSRNSDADSHGNDTGGDVSVVVDLEAQLVQEMDCGSTIRFDASHRWSVSVPFTVDEDIDALLIATSAISTCLGSPAGPPDCDPRPFNWTLQLDGGDFLQGDTDISTVVQLPAGSYIFAAQDNAPVSYETTTAPGNYSIGRIGYVIFGVRQFDLTYGDGNCDGTVSVGDIAPLVTLLTNPGAYSTLWSSCDRDALDMNKDGRLNPGDIGEFVRRLTNQY